MVWSGDTEVWSGDTEVWSGDTSANSITCWPRI